MENICIQCGNKFISPKKRKYCSENCKSKFKYYNMKNYKNICLFCRKEFSSHRKEQRFCNKSCAAKYQKNSDITVEQIVNFIKKENSQPLLIDIQNHFSISSHKVYNLLKQKGYNSYKEFIKDIFGEYQEKQRSDLSSSALKCFNILKEILSEEYILEKDFDNFINPITKRKLRFDCYFPQHNLIVEYNGIQHYKNIPFFHQNNNSLEYQRYKDNLKIDYCKNNNIKLIIVKYTDELTKENLNKILCRANQQPSQENNQ